MAEEPGRQSEAEPPALPPRPPPRPRQPVPPPAPPPPPRGKSSALQHSCWLRKYVFLCTACGGLAVLLGTLFLTVYFMLRSYTSSLNYFETVPTYVPAAMLIVTGLVVMCLAARKNRYGYLIKLCGACCMTCAVLCVVVTISTTVVHMNRLQSLRECVYTQKTQTCTCYSVVLEPVNGDQSEEGVRYVFNTTPDCEVIHGALYSCLRAMFGLSVIGILICIFSCMLVYQLLSHEKKKMYWEQLEIRCRYLYHQQRAPHHCGCCEECRYELFPWEVMDDRFWTPGRIGNLYSPNPGEEGNAVSQRPTSGWSWRRLPWTRNSAPQTVRESNSQNYRNTASSPDSQYGFSSRPDPESYSRRDQPNSSVSSIQVEGYCQRYYMWGPPPPYSNHSSPACREPIFSLLPHQNAGSPLRGHHHHHCQMQRHRRAQDPRCFEELSTAAPAEEAINTNDAGKNVAVENYLDSNAEISGDATSEINSNLSGSKDRASNTLPARRTKKRTDISSVKSVSNIPFSFDQQQKNMKVPQDNFSPIGNSNALPRTNVQLLFEPQCVKNSENFPNSKHNIKNICTTESEEIDNRYAQTLSTVPVPSRNENIEGSAIVHYRPCHQDLVNSTIEELECAQRNKNEPTESEVYFADVSSCCNVSVRNDGQDSSLYDEVSNPQKQRLTMIALRERTAGYPTSGHVHKLQDMFAEKNRKQNVQAEIIHQNSPIAETRDFHKSSGEVENGNQYVHRICDEGNATSYRNSSDNEQTVNCFGQQRPHSTVNQKSIGHPHGPTVTDQEQSLTENTDVCHKIGHPTGRSFLDMGNRKPVCNNRIDLTKDSPEHNISNLSGYPINENDSPFVSPMSSASTSSPNNFSAEPIENCEIFYHPENNGTREAASDSTSASSALNRDTFNYYPAMQKTLYEQEANVQKNKFLLQQQRNNLLNLGCENTDFLPLHRNEQLFLAPDAQYETISQSPQANVPQSYICNMHPSNFTVSQDGFNGNVSTHAALRTNVTHHNVVHDSSVQHGHRCDNPQALRNVNMTECPYQAATSTEEEESESHNQQSNCYSDATMDSGCHSGSEFPSNRRGGKIVSRTVPEVKDVGVTIVRSVNV